MASNIYIIKIQLMILIGIINVLLYKFGQMSQLSKKVRMDNNLRQREYLDMPFKF